jgi:hypothetical protein
MTSAGPSATRIAAADDLSKKTVRTRIPCRRATAAASADGSTPRCRTPASRTARSITPSLEPISTRNGSVPCGRSPSSSRAVPAKCARITAEPEERYG